MGNISRSRRIGSGPDTGFVGIQTPLDAVHHAGPADATQDLLEVKGIGQHLRQDGGDHPDMHHDDHQGQQHVQHPHERHQYFRDPQDPFAPAHEAVAHQHGQDGADDPGGDSFHVEPVHTEGGLEVVGSQGIEPAGIGNDQEKGKGPGQQFVVQGIFNVVSRPAVAVPIGIPAFVHLSQGAFDESRCAPDDGNGPHPEHGAEAPQTQSGGNPDDVPGTHPGSGGNHQGLERRNGTFLAGFLHDHADAFPEPAELDQTGADGEEETGRQQDDDQDGIIQYVVHGGE